MTTPVHNINTFNSLVTVIGAIHGTLAEQAAKAVNVSLTARNWLIGLHIHEYELHGADRATYGEKLLATLAEALQKQGMRRCDRRELYRYRQFYRVYPQIGESLSPQLLLLIHSAAPRSIVETLSPQYATHAKQLLERLSFSHLAELIDIDDPLKRLFYETECMRGVWSVRELKRQIATLYFERNGLSADKQKLAEHVGTIAESAIPVLEIRDPYIFEFLGIKPGEVMYESDLEHALLGKLQEFMLELGRGFCFEARQKRILIGDDYFFVDLVFYHRILKCHVLIELKVDEFSHEHLGQLNTYLNWYKRHETTEGDNPPIGILLCTKKNHALIEYALAGMDNQLFVSKYQVALPSRDEMREFIESQMELEDDL